MGYGWHGTGDRRGLGGKPLCPTALACGDGGARERATFPASAALIVGFRIAVGLTLAGNLGGAW